MFRRVASISTALAVLVAAVVGSAPSATAADLSLFDPGLIISDAVFYNAATMSPSDIQAFLSTQGAGCVPASDGTACLKDFTVTSSTRTATYCQPYQGATNESAAQVIYKVAQACGINPRVLLVTMQKEQTLVTRRIAGSAAIYAKAMGFACPDTQPCDPAAGGFAVQVYLAANQFQRYKATPRSYRFQPNATNLVPYHPTDPFATNAGGCGGSQVAIRSQATAGLYNYTPYQPNAAALAAGAGLGDVCSSYGNRNFWRFFVDWFGSPVQQAPIGAADFVRGGNNVIALAGWALDPDTTGSIQVHAYVDGVGTPLIAAGSRPDIGAAFRRGDSHGFDVQASRRSGQPQRVPLRDRRHRGSDEHDTRLLDGDGGQPAADREPRHADDVRRADLAFRAGPSTPTPMRRSRRTCTSTGSAHRCSPPARVPTSARRSAAASAHGFAAVLRGDDRHALGVRVRDQHPVRTEPDTRVPQRDGSGSRVRPPIGARDLVQATSSGVTSHRLGAGPRHHGADRGARLRRRGRHTDRRPAVSSGHRRGLRQG